MKINAYHYPEGGYVGSSGYTFASGPPLVFSQRSGMESQVLQTIPNKPSVDCFRDQKEAMELCWSQFNGAEVAVLLECNFINFHLVIQTLIQGAESGFDVA